MRNIGLIGWFVVLRGHGYELGFTPVWAVYTAGVIYGIWAHIQAARTTNIRRAAVVTTFSDPVLAGLICVVTGGIDSVLYPFFYFTQMSVAIRFGVWESIGIACFNCFLTVAIFLVEPIYSSGASASTPLMLATKFFLLGFSGFMGAILAEWARERRAVGARDAHSRSAGGWAEQQDDCQVAVDHRGDGEVAPQENLREAGRGGSCACGGHCVGDPHVSVGLVAGDGGAIIWPQLVGYARARDYLFTGKLAKAEEAERIGLINRVVSPEQLDEAVYGLAQQLADGATKSIRWTKIVTNTPLKALAHHLFDMGLAYENMSNSTKDHQEAVNAFRERRKPVFTGK